MVDARRKPETKPARYKPFPRIYTRGLVHVTLIASLPVVQTIRVSSIFQPARVSANPPTPLSFIFPRIWPFCNHFTIHSSIRDQRRKRTFNFDESFLFSFSLSLFPSIFIEFAVYRIVRFIYFLTIIIKRDREKQRGLRSLTRFL